MSPFEAARKLLSTETTRMSLMDRAELVFQDLDLVPLLIQVVDQCSAEGYSRSESHVFTS